ncbi:transposase family protein [Streptomyces sp. Tue6028]|uniref:transposase family protein n=1 Tax=Streptomyces sp. Tue6028 TaxID=2036037 RepID=UPI00359C8605
MVPHAFAQILRAGSVPGPRTRRGRWYSLTAILLVCACAVVSGARSIDELAEWGQPPDGSPVRGRFRGSAALPYRRKTLGYLICHIHLPRLVSLMGTRYGTVRRPSHQSRTPAASRKSGRDAAWSRSRARRGLSGWRPHKVVQLV